MKDESGMNKEIEQVIKIIRNIKTTFTPESFKEEQLAKWHLRQVRIAEIKARINELQRTCDFSEYRGRYEDLQVQLAEAEKESK